MFETSRSTIRFIRKGKHKEICWTWEFLWMIEFLPRLSFRSVYQRLKLWNYHIKIIYSVIIFTWNKCLSSRLIKCALFGFAAKHRLSLLNLLKQKNLGKKKQKKGAKIIIWTEHSITIIKSQMLFLLWWFHRYNPEICVVIKIILCCWAINDRQTLLICHRGVSYYFCSHCWELRIVYDFLRLYNIPTHVIVDVAPNHLTMK